MANKFWICATPHLRLLALLAVAFTPAACAAENCPWLNAATASGLIGANATAVYTAAAAGKPAVCTFTEASAHMPRVLEIRVEIVPDPHVRLMALDASCTGAASPLTAIGNEAIACSADEHKDKPAERVVGRVRDQVFTITLTSNGKQDSVLDRDELKIRISTAAEQVSGNLF